MIYKRLVINRAAIAAITMMAVGIGWCSGTAVASSAIQFCSSHELREYYPPLKGMRTVPEPPASGRLPFGPAELEIQTGSSLLAGAGQIGLDVDGHLKYPSRLHWNIVTQLRRVDRKGRPGSVLRERHESVGIVRKDNALPLDLSFRVGKSPAFYRVDSYFRSWAGRKLAHYAEYFRVMKRTVEVKLGIYDSSLHPGDTLVTRLENLGTATISFGKEFALEIWDGTTWALSPVTPAGFLGVGLGIGGGGAAECDKVRLPIDVAPGLYRMSKPYSVAASGHSDQVVRVEFDVSA